MSASNYPPGVTGAEDYFWDDEELNRVRKRKSPTAKELKEAAKAYEPERTRKPKQEDK